MLSKWHVDFVRIFQISTIYNIYYGTKVLIMLLYYDSHNDNMTLLYYYHQGISHMCG